MSEGGGEGGEDGPRRAEGRGRGEGGKEKRANVGRTRFLWSLVIDENVCVSLQQYFSVAAESCVFG